jgi:hypothetical protein
MKAIPLTLIDVVCHDNATEKRERQFFWGNQLIFLFGLIYFFIFKVISTFCLLSLSYLYWINTFFSFESVLLPFTFISHPHHRMILPSIKGRSQRKKFFVAQSRSFHMND